AGLEIEVAVAVALAIGAPGDGEVADAELGTDGQERDLEVIAKIEAVHGRVIGEGLAPGLDPGGCERRLPAEVVHGVHSGVDAKEGHARSPAEAEAERVGRLAEGVGAPAGLGA